MTTKSLNSKDLLLCFLYSPGVSEEINEPIIGRTKLTKMMYLFEKQIYDQFFKDNILITLPQFEPYYFGPFSRQLFEDLSFFQSIGLILVNNTTIPLSPADLVESEEVFDETGMNEWDSLSFAECEEKFELSYKLSNSGVRYVENKLWSMFTTIQKDTLSSFKSQINKISLDALLRYVYNKYPQDTTKSRIADKYLKKVDN